MAERRSPARRVLLRSGALLASALLTGLPAHAQAVNPHPYHLQLPPARPLSAMAKLGKRLFNDARLSGSGRISCGNCHSAAHAYGPPGDSAVVFEGNCAACHLDQQTRDGRPPLFTDFQYEALGVPRNPAIPANRDPRYFDLGVCGPYRTDLRTETQYCGMFITPTLRNVATRRVFFHNGAFHSLREVFEWYVYRDLAPERLYSRDAAGRVVKYDDLPPEYRRNVDVVDAPFNRHPGEAPALNDAEIGDVIAFLNTLTDESD